MSTKADYIYLYSWAIRNCGLMLFRALMNRMCRLRRGGSRIGFGGTSGSEPGCRISFDKYPNLVSLLSQLLGEPERYANGGTAPADRKAWEISVGTERIFPALELIGEKAPSVISEQDHDLRILVSRQFRNSVWGIREHAARIYASLLNFKELLPSVKGLSNTLPGVASQNHVHGIVLCIRYTLQRFWNSPGRLWQGAYIIL